MRFCRPPLHRCWAGVSSSGILSGGEALRQERRAGARPAGTVLLGEDGEGRPGRKVAVPAFRIDRHEVTNRQFAAFVEVTGYRTAAEREGGSALFVPLAGPVDLDNPASWWRYRTGADWRHP